MTDIEERLARLEAATRYNSRFLRQSATRTAQREAAELEARLAPLLPTGAAGVRSSASTDPDLSSALLDRLRADAGLSYAVAGSAVSAQSSANVLPDPSFDTVEQATLTTSWQAMGPYWEACYVLDSGTAPNLVRLEKYPERVFYASARLRVYAEWTLAADVGQITVQVRSSVSQLPYIDWPWLVASVRGSVNTDETHEGSGIATVAVAILNTGPAGDMVSDPTDLESLAEVAQEGRPFVGLADPLTELYPDARPKVRFDVVLSSEASTLQRIVSVELAEPVLVWADEESPHAYQSGSGTSGIPRVFGVRAVLLDDLTISNSVWEALEFPVGSVRMDYANTDIYDPLVGPYKRFYAPVPGVYRCAAIVEWEVDSSGSRQVRIVRRDVAGNYDKVEARNRIGASVTGVTTVTLSSEIRMSAGDYVVFEVYHTKTAGTLDVLGPATDVATVVEVRLVGNE